MPEDRFEIQGGLALDFPLKPDFEEVNPLLFDPYVRIKEPDKKKRGLQQQALMRLEELSRDRGEPHEAKINEIIKLFTNLRAGRDDQGAARVMVRGLYTVARGEVLNISSENPLPTVSREQQVKIRGLFTGSLHEVIDRTKTESDFIRKYVMRQPISSTPK
jgi:hypothetical protein